MAEIFVDTSGLAAYFEKGEFHHRSAVALVRKFGTTKTKLLTTNYVINELSALLLRPKRVGRSRRLEILEEMKSEPWLEVVHIDVEVDLKAWQLLKSRPDKDWSLVDCSSFVVMRERGISHALTNDRHFEQAGFTRLLA